MVEDNFYQKVKGGKKRKEEELNFSEKTTSTCYPVGQFSIYRLDKVSAPATQTSVLTPISRILWAVRHSNRRITVILNCHHPKNGADGCEQLPDWQ